MSSRPRVSLRLAPVLRARRRASLSSTRVRLPDGADTTVHIAAYDRAAFTARIVALPAPQPLAGWCRRAGVAHAVVGGFFRRPEYVPLGEVRVAGRVRPFHPVDGPWGAMRGCVAIAGASVEIARRHELAADFDGDLLQAGPVLVREGGLAVADDRDAEGFSAGAHQFDSDITRGRYPRAALGVTPSRLLAVACDGRTERDAGMTLPELAHLMRSLGATDALNLDGGGSASLVYNGRLRNRPREEHGVDLLGGRAIVTALVFEPGGPTTPR